MIESKESPWNILDSEIKYENPWIELTEYRVLNPNGGKGIYGVVHFKNLAIGIVAMDEDDNIYLVGQYRFPLERYSWEIPEGGGPLDIDPLESAKRELLEETGLKADQWEEILEMYLSNSVSDEKCIVYLATGLSQHTPQPEETEALRIKKIPLTDAYDLVLKGEIGDAITVAALFKMKLKGQ